MARSANVDFVIWSFEHNAWWGPHRWGYTSQLAQAGRYSEAEATAIVMDANRYSKEPNEAMIRFADAQLLEPLPS